MPFVVRQSVAQGPGRPGAESSIHTPSHPGMFLQFNIFTRRQLHRYFGTVHLAGWGWGPLGQRGWEVEGRRRRGQPRGILASGGDRPAPANGPSWNVLAKIPPTPTHTQTSVHTVEHTHSTLLIASQPMGLQVSEKSSDCLHQNLRTKYSHTVRPGKDSLHKYPTDEVKIQAALTKASLNGSL